MTDTTNQPPKRNYTKIIFTVITLALAAIGLDRFTLDILPIGAHIAATGKDTTISSKSDSTKAVPAANNGGNQNESWIGKKVIIKQNSDLYNLIPFPTGENWFNCTGDNGNNIQINDVTSTCFPKSEFEIYRSKFTPDPIPIGISDSGSNSGSPVISGNFNPNNLPSGQGNNTYNHPGSLTGNDVPHGHPAKPK